MNTATWEIDEAKDHLREVIDNARQQGEQTITQDGKPVVVVKAVEETKNDQNGTIKPGTGESLINLLRRCPAPEIFDIMEKLRAEDRARDLRDLGLK
ncbi:MAG TPA: type II toxin-antitoxin system prevent-host-death family antitoxin [Chthoniobacteraceae bacterium]|jgi:prevent-host-death family protein|nr:type II toxin-antitoxin system prevent-host-death family antitoxin [Chthoniobacteraceae bacterium]